MILFLTLTAHNKLGRHARRSFCVVFPVVSKLGENIYDHRQHRAELKQPFMSFCGQNHVHVRISLVVTTMVAMRPMAQISRASVVTMNQATLVQARSRNKRLRGRREIMRSGPLTLASIRMVAVAILTGTISIVPATILDARLCSKTKNTGFVTEKSKISHMSRTEKTR